MCWTFFANINKMRHIIIYFFLFGIHIVKSQIKVEYNAIFESSADNTYTKYEKKSDLKIDGTYSEFNSNRMINGKPEVIKSSDNYPSDVRDYILKMQAAKKYPGDEKGDLFIKDIENDSLIGRILNYDKTYSRIANKLPKFKTEILDETKQILGYKCQKAIMEVYDKKVTVWFTTELPYSTGPWVLHGLPGLILSVDTGEFKFEALEIKKIEPFEKTKFTFKKTVTYEGYKEENYNYYKKKIKYEESQNTDPNLTIKTKIVKIDFPIVE